MSLILFRSIVPSSKVHLHFNSVAVDIEVIDFIIQTHRAKNSFSLTVEVTSNGHFK